MSAIFDSIQVSDEVKRYVDHSFEIVECIHAILEKQGKNQRDLAKMLGKKESEISKWMQGTHNFTLKSISKIEAALGETIIQAPSITAVKFVPVTVHSNLKRPVTQTSFESQARWGRSNTKAMENGLKSA